MFRGDPVQQAKAVSVFAEQFAAALDAVMDAEFAQSLPRDGLQRGDHRDSEIALQRLDRVGHRPVGTGKK